MPLNLYYYYFESHHPLTFCLTTNKYRNISLFVCVCVCVYDRRNRAATMSISTGTQGSKFVVAAGGVPLGGRGGRVIMWQWRGVWSSCLPNCRRACWYSRGRVAKLRVEGTSSYSLFFSVLFLICAARWGWRTGHHISACLSLSLYPSLPLSLSLDR